MFDFSISYAYINDEKYLPKNILIYYSSNDTLDVEYSNDIVELLGSFFDYYGFNFKLQNLNEGIGDPTIRDWADIYLICQYNSIHKFGEELCNFLISVLDKKKIILTTLLGAPNLEEKLIHLMGFLPIGYINKNKIKYFKEYDNFQDFAETSAVPILTYDYYCFKPLENRTDAKIYISACGDGTIECPILAKSKNGAIFFLDKVLQVDKNYDRRWMFNPYKILKLILYDENEKYLVADPIVQSGRRIAFIHIDGDGFNYKTEFDNSRYSGDVIFKEIIKYYKLPVSASLIVSEIHPNEGGSNELLKLVKEMFLESYVEPASHTWYHPFKWQYLSLNSLEELKEEDTETDQIEEMRIYNRVLNKKTCLFKEIVESCQYIEQLAGKQCNLIFWSGMCNPTVSALELCEKYGIYNINGGDTRFEGDFKLFSNLRAHYSPNQQYIRFNARYVNEFIMTDHWSPPFNNYKNVIEGFKNTASPYLITPINIYYHFYSGIRIDSLNALKEVYNYVISLQPSFVSVKVWIDKVRGFLNCKIKRLNINEDLINSEYVKKYYNGDLKIIDAFEFKDNGELDNFRWDFEGYPLINHNEGVYSFNKINNSIYVNVGNNKNGKIIIVDKMPSSLYLKSLTGKTLNIEKVLGDDGYLKVYAHHVGPFKAEFANAIHYNYKIYFTNSKNETSAYIPKIDNEKKEFYFYSPYENGNVILTIYFTSKLGALKSYIKGIIVRMYYIINQNLVILITILIYIYFVKIKIKKTRS